MVLRQQISEPECRHNQEPGRNTHFQVPSSPTKCWAVWVVTPSWGLKSIALRVRFPLTAPSLLDTDQCVHLKPGTACNAVGNWGTVFLILRALAFWPFPSVTLLCPSLFSIHPQMHLYEALGYMEVSSSKIFFFYLILSPTLHSRGKVIKWCQPNPAGLIASVLRTIKYENSHTRLSEFELLADCMVAVECLSASVASSVTCES